MKQLKDLMDEYFQRTQYTPSYFSKLSRTSLVAYYNLCNGRKVHRNTERRIRDFIQNNPPEIITKGTKHQIRDGIIQVGGNHYDIPYQAIDFIIDEDIDYIRGSIIKYIVRAPKKGGAQDIDKAISLVPLVQYRPVFRTRSLKWFMDKNKNHLSQNQLDLVSLALQVQPETMEDLVTELVSYRSTLCQH